jgi:hypothetical protein
MVSQHDGMLAVGGSAKLPAICVHCGDPGTAAHEWRFFGPEDVPSPSSLAYHTVEYWLCDVHQSERSWRIRLHWGGVLMGLGLGAVLLAVSPVVALVGPAAAIVIYLAADPPSDFEVVEFDEETYYLAGPDDAFLEYLPHSQG